MYPFYTHFIYELWMLIRIFSFQSKRTFLGHANCQINSCDMLCCETQSLRNCALLMKTRRHFEESYFKLNRK